VPAPPSDIRDLAARDRAVVFHPDLPNDSTDRVVLASGEGSVLTDVHGRSYLDLAGSAWLCQVGHGRAELAEIAAAQMARLEHIPTRWEYSSEPAIAFAERLVELAPPGIAKVQHATTGSEATEVALKMVRYYHHQRGEPDRTMVLALRGAYHGYGAGGSALGGPRPAFGPGVPGVIQLTPPWPYHPELHDDGDPTDYCIAELERTIEVGAGRIAAMFGEPAMAAAGMVILPDDYWPRVAEMLSAHGILLVLDEVVTAFGRTGAWFAANHYGVRPDVVVTAKGIASGYVPLGAVLLSERVADVIGSGAGFPVASSYGGHAVASAVGLASIEIIERERLLERATDTGGHLLRRLTELLADVPIVGDVRGLGLMIGVELVADRRTRAPLPAATDLARVLRDEAGLLVSVARSTVMLTPPLVLTMAEADAAAEGLHSVLARLRPDGTLHAGASVSAIV
jgi:adenosylmethionine-8-amino-7-oxononanoate aminotransferase